MRTSCALSATAAVLLTLIPAATAAEIHDAARADDLAAVRWEEDLDAMVSFIESNHSNPFSKRDRSSFERDVERRSSR